ncbi:bifunctional metallophosphatase/5'-nucleotidase [Priestia megaterium]|nr:bifunctional metallophosphatase/5'-nucleotidase [Priestia megaterium]
MNNLQNKCVVAILETSDIHGNVVPVNYGNNEETNTGLAKAANLILDQQAQHEYSLLIDNGDLIQGTPLTYHYAKFLYHKKNPMIQIVNDLQYDLAVLGNHEFNFGIELLEKAVEQSRFPWLAANILDQNTGQPKFGKPYIIKEFNNGLRVAVLGVTTHYIPNWENPKHIQGLEFENVLESTKKWVKSLQKNEEYDLLIVSYHGGFEKDLSNGEPTESLTGENQGYQICQEIDGIDILLTGHQHRQIANEINGVTVIQPGFNGQSIGKVEVMFEQVDGKWRVENKKPSILEVTSSIEPMKDILKVTEEYEKETQTWLDQPIGQLKGNMLIDDVMQVRLQDHPLIEFINKVQMDATGAPISNTALFHNGSPGFPENVTMRDIVSNYIYPNTLKVILISGQDIKDALEKSATYFMLDEDCQIKVNPFFIEPKPQHYNYDMWEGIEYELKISNPEGERVVKLNYQNKPLDMQQQFEVVMNNYRASGGGEFEMFKNKPVVKEIQIDMTEIIAEYILKRKVITATCDNSWRVFV